MAPKCHAKIVIFFHFSDFFSDFFSDIFSDFFSDFLSDFLSDFFSGLKLHIVAWVTVKLKFVHVVEAGKAKSRS